MSDRTSDWGGLGAIVDEARELDQEQRDAPIEACPLCGTPLDFNSRGVGNCPMGHFRTETGRPRE